MFQTYDHKFQKARCMKYADHDMFHLSDFSVTGNYIVLQKHFQLTLNMLHFVYL